MPAAQFRFYGELNDFLSIGWRQRTIPHEFQGAPAVKDAIEALGVPHVEVELVLLNGESVDFSSRLRPDDRVAVYPMFESLDITLLLRLRKRPLRRIAFVADVHLGKLARLLRLLGFDVLHSNGYRDEEIVAVAVRENRIVLTRDREILKRNVVQHGYWIRSDRPLEQAREVVQRFDLAALVEPFRRCLACNGLLAPVAKDTVLSQIPPRVAAWRDVYFRCSSCGKLYWKGTHHPKLSQAIARILSREERGAS
ncbi:TPA: twitching motility protein PilT [Candidatus Acetothermia bacterium]|nr:twitching motility protein PilT [Candidatus Acetothermia bacterium]